MMSSSEAAPRARDCGNHKPGSGSCGPSSSSSAFSSSPAAGGKSCVRCSRAQLECGCCGECAAPCRGLGCLGSLYHEGCIDLREDDVEIFWYYFPTGASRHFKYSEVEAVKLVHLPVWKRKTWGVAFSFIWWTWQMREDCSFTSKQTDLLIKIKNCKLAIGITPTNAYKVARLLAGQVRLHSDSSFEFQDETAGHATTASTNLHSKPHY
eukprot:GHVT01073413.1.p1 GENE.GHVT01073413.1~~GHVT01073413.1.p1  ORF type:complete len:209 (+),score=42.48 GHVT01073413.1:171-797(+)